MRNPFDQALKTYMYKIAGINQVVITEKATGNVIGSFVKFALKEGTQDIATISNTLYQLSRTMGQEMESNITEFGDGDKLFTINGGRNVLLSAISDKSVQVGIMRMYLKSFAESINRMYTNVQSESVSPPSDPDLHDIFRELSGT